MLTIQHPHLMRPLNRGAIIIRLTEAHLPTHPIRIPQLLILRHPIMRTIEAQSGNPVVPHDARSFLQTSRDVIADFAENADMALDDFFVGAVGYVAGDVLDEALLGAFVPDALPQGAGGVEVFGPNFREEGYGLACEVALGFVEVDGAVAEPDGFDGADVIGSSALVVEGHGAVALEVGHVVGRAGRVDGELLVVDADAVAVGVGVGEEAGLEDGIRGGFDARDQVGRVEGDLFDLGEVVLGVFVEGENADFAAAELLFGPDVG